MRQFVQAVRRTDDMTVSSLSMRRACMIGGTARKIGVVQQLFLHANEPLPSFAGAAEATVSAR